MGYVFLIPGFVFLGCFLVFPFFKSLVRSFTDWNAFSPDFSFVGLKTTLSCFIMTNIGRRSRSIWFLQWFPH